MYNVIKLICIGGLGHLYRFTGISSLTSWNMATITMANDFTSNFFLFFFFLCFILCIGVCSITILQYAVDSDICSRLAFCWNAQSINNNILGNFHCSTPSIDVIYNPRHYQKRTLCTWSADHSTNAITNHAKIFILISFRFTAAQAVCLSPLSVWVYRRSSKWLSSILNRLTSMIVVVFVFFSLVIFLFWIQNEERVFQLKNYAIVRKQRGSKSQAIVRARRRKDHKVHFIISIRCWTCAISV